jgi:hypothetical protein
MDGKAVMGYALPTMNLTCRIWSGNALPPQPHRADKPCQLRAPGKASTGQDALNQGWPFLWSLILPALTDIRDNGSLSGSDRVECPQGSGRFYDVIAVDDVAKGFANEYRIAFLRKRGGWPTPIP